MDEILTTMESVTMNNSDAQNDALQYMTQKNINDKYVGDILIPSIVYTCILFVIGVPGNAVVTYVYFFKLKRKPFSAFIVALAVFDLLNCLISMPTEVAILLNFFVFDHSVICKLARFVTFYMNAASCIVLLAIALTRFKGICFPLAKWNVRPKITVIASLVVSALTCWPALFLYGTFTTEIRIPGTNRQVFLKSCLIDDNFKNTVYPSIHSYYLLGTHVFFDSCFIVLYSLVGFRVFRQRNFGSTRRASRMSSSSQDDETKLKRGGLFRTSSKSSTKSFPEIINLRAQNKTNQNCSNDSLEPFINSGIKLLDMKTQCYKMKMNSKGDDSYSNSMPCLSPSSEENLTLERIKRINSSKGNNKQSLRRIDLLSNGGTTNSLNDSKRDLNKISPSFRERELGNRSPSVRRFVFTSSQSMKRTFSTASEPFAHGRSFAASRTAKMLFAVTLLFLLTFLPYCVIVIIRIQNPSFYEHQTNTQKLFYNLFLRSYMLSSALNPVIYNFYNHRFRTECKKLLKTILCFLNKRTK